MELLVLLEVGSTLYLRIYGFGTNNVSGHNVPGGISEACSGMRFLLSLYTLLFGRFECIFTRNRFSHRNTRKRLEALQAIASIIS